MSAAHHVELRGSVPRSARAGDPVACKWELRNDGVAEILAGFYLRAAPASLAALACVPGEARCGRFHGSAAVLIPAGETATVSALLATGTTGDHPVRIAVVTRHESIERTDIVHVTSIDESGDRSSADR
jgi:hypothetical protein